MKKYIQMISVLTLIATVCGFLLAAVKNFTAPRIEEQLMKHVKGPAVRHVLLGSQNDVTADRQEVIIDGNSIMVFTGKKEGQPWAIAFESSAPGFGGNISIMVGFNLEDDKLTGIAILTHQETPGVGARITETVFTGKFNGLPLATDFRVKKDGGMIDGLSGATISSRGVCAALSKCIALYPEIKKNLLQGPGTQ